MTRMLGFAAALRHGAMAGHGAIAVRGLAVSEHGLALDRTGAVPGRSFALGFRITDADGETARDFDVDTVPFTDEVLR